MSNSERAIYISADKDALTGGIQLSIGVQDADGGGHGYRIAGPKYSGSSQTLKKHVLTERDAQSIYGYIKPLLARTDHDLK